MSTPLTTFEASPREASPYARHLPSLDGIRGLAILLVLIGHLFPSNNRSTNALLQVVLSLRGLTWVGVNLFFALSGFLITGILYDTLGTPEYFRSFFGRRLLRISPLYYGVLLVLLALTPFVNLHWNGSAILFLTYTQNLPFIPNPIGPAPWAVLRHFWSLAVEEQFYLVWPFVIFWLKSWRKIMVAALIGSAIALLLRTVLAITGSYPQNHSTLFCMDALLLGGILALLVRSRHHDATLRLGLPVFVLAALLIVIPAIRQPDFDWERSAYLTTIGLTIVDIGAVAIIAAALRQGSQTRRFFSANILRFFGKYSYGLYVFHYSIDAVLANPLRAFFVSHGAGKGLTILATGLITLAASIVAALISYYGFERYFLRLKRFFPYTRSIVS